MATNYTECLGLCLWSADDPILRTEFNYDHNKLDAYIRKLPRIVRGSYVGTGLSGPENPTVLTFDINPQLVIILENSTSSLNPAAIFIKGQTESSGLGHLSSSSDSMRLHVDWVETSVSFYNEEVSGSSNAERQLNKEGSTYYYFVFGL